MGLDYQDEGLWNPIDGDFSAYPSWVASNDTTGSGLNFSSGWNDTLQGLVKLAGGTAATTALMEQNQQGQRYLMGQRYASLNQPLGLNSGTLLLIGGGILLWSLFKG